jgi:hypothetical protein
MVIKSEIVNLNLSLNISFNVIMNLGTGLNIQNIFIQKLRMLQKLF